MKTRSFLALTRPANVVTAVSDILAGAAIAGFLSQLDVPGIGQSLVLLSVATSCLYAGGIVFNDYFDREIDQIERPERLIPSGQITPNEALTFALVLFLAAIIAAFLVNLQSGFIALSIAIMAVMYDKFGKHHRIMGPLTMGLCRGLNLLLGMSIIPTVLTSNLIWMGLVPVIFIGAITLTSQGEVNANNRTSIKIALALDLLVSAIIIVLGVLQILNLRAIIPFLLIWAGMNIRAKVLAVKNNESRQIKIAVKTGVISLIPLNAIYAAGFGHWWFGIAVLLLLPLAFLLSKRFAVT